MIGRRDFQSHGGGRNDRREELGTGVEVEYTGSLYLEDRIGALEEAADKCLVWKQTAEERKESTAHFLELWEEINGRTQDYLLKA